MAVRVLSINLSCLIQCHDVGTIFHILKIRSWNGEKLVFSKSKAAEYGLDWVIYWSPVLWTSTV